MSRPWPAVGLIVNADDLGWSEGVNRGIFQAHREGIVSSATLAANMPAAEAALAALDKHPRLGVGLHLNVCQGRPLSRSAAEVLAPDGGAMDRTGAEVIRLCLLHRRLALAAIQEEFTAQVEWALAAGLRPTHVDTHRHVHAWPAVFRLVGRLCERYDIPFVRRHREVLIGRGWPRAPRKQRRTSRILNLLGRRCERIAPGLLGTTGTLGVAHTGAIDRAFLRRAIGALGPGVTEIMTHPGCADGLEVGATTRLLESRQAELEALCDGDLIRGLADRGIERVHYGQLI
ncbi:MAG TPA: ChbG/HpnK family deacetylase [Phycisphaerae bacterium]|nr:ChbG/HpnK family deacetylase [Phycisphaerae bacterium]